MFKYEKKHRNPHYCNCIEKKNLNSLPNDQDLDLSKLKGFADDNLNLTLKLQFILERIENIVGNGENPGYQHFLLFPQCF